MIARWFWRELALAVAADRLAGVKPRRGLRAGPGVDKRSDGERP